MSLTNKKITVTGGPTREWLDPVRFLSNPSSGKMGIAIADEAEKRAGETVFIHGSISTSLLKEKKYRKISIETTEDLLNAVKNEITPNSILIMAAAPADYTPAVKSDEKIKKGQEAEEFTITLKKTPDILKHIAKLREENPTLRDIFVVGFAAETHDIEKNAVQKLQNKNLDMICLNDVSRKDAGFTADTNLITIFKKNGERIDLPLMSKQEVAERILNEIEQSLKI